jgi:RNA polymerase sigma-70 factor (ECF subfamily)
VRQIAALRLGCRLREIAEHEDVVQDAMMNAFQALDRFEGRSEGSFRDWLARCVVNAARDRFRRAKAEKRGGGRVRVLSSFRQSGDEQEELTAMVFAGKDPTPSAELSAKELGERLEKALLDLAEHHREVIVLRLLCDLSYQEIGRQLGIDQEATVRKLYSRAMAKLRAVCEE